MEKFPFAVVAFDLDGTLVDSAPDLTAALNFALRQFDRGEVTEAMVRGMIGRGVRVLIEQGLGATGDVSPELIDEVLPVYLQYYLAHIADGTRPYEGVEPALTLLREQGARLAMCTNKPEGHTRKLLTALGWTEYFASVIGGDTLPVRKPDAMPLLEAVARAGGGAAVLVGDSITDVETARAARLPCVVLSHGFRDRPAEELGADRVIERFADLVSMLASMAPPLK